MRWLVPLLLLVAGLAGPAAAQSSGVPDQTLVFYNARIALREGRTDDVLKLWLLRNNLRQRGEMGAHDADFRSVVWAALGQAGYCQDGFPKDDDGAGLWPIALHNWLVQSLGKGPPVSARSPWEVFDVGRQQRLISLHDVLSAEEHRTVEFFRTGCLLPFTTMLDLKGTPFLDLQDRLEVGLLMRELLARSRSTLVAGKVLSAAAIEARIFDLDLAIADLQVRRARREGREAAQRARGAGASKAAAEEVRQEAARWPEDSPQADFLRGALRWKASEWMTLSPQRRQSLFARARPLAKDREALNRLVLEIIDRLIDAREGEEITAWIGFLDAKDAPHLRAAVTGGERGKRLLELDPKTGFRERGVVALHRGVAFLEAGNRREALRSFAYALHHAEDSRDADTTLALGRRWLSYVLARYETSSEVIATLRALVPRQEYNAVIEDLVWRAALRADRASFDRLTASARRGGAFDYRIARLQPLADGDAGRMATQLRDALDEEPHAVLQFTKLLLEHLESEDGEVRIANVPTLKALRRVLDPLAAGPDQKSVHTRTAKALVGRTQAILDGLSHVDTSEQGQARMMSLQAETFAGSIRLAPADPLPWPFPMPDPEAPSAFVPIVLEPVEWRDAGGRLVFGWRIHE